MNIYYIDLFCGAGGVTSGVVRAGAKVIACINHDPLAIKSHYANHKNVLHFTEDIKHFNVHILKRMVEDIRAHDPNAIIVLWASLECTHFSKAKGGESRDADSRTLAEHLYRYIEAVKPDYIDIENVMEFMSWGPLRIACAESLPDRSVLKVRTNGEYHWIPESKKNGRYYTRWIQHIKEYGYEYEYRLLNAADFGARTSRIRYFGQFKKSQLPFTWPESTHAKNPQKLNGGMFKKVHKWKPVRPALDLTDKGKSIFGRKKPLSENTLKRLYGGMVKHVGTGKEPEFITKWMSGGMKNIGLDEPVVTITTMNHLGIVQPEFIVKYNSKNQKTGATNPVSLDSPAPTITTQFGMNVVCPEFVMKYFSGRPEGKVKSLNEPLGSITCFGGGALVQLEFISKYFTGPDHSQKTNEPAGAITTKDHHAVVFLAKYHGNGDNTQAIDGPCSTVLAADTLSLFWLDKQFRSDANHQSMDVPSGAILPNDKHCKVEAILVNNYSSGGQHSSIDSVAPSITTVPKSNLGSIEYKSNHLGILEWDDIKRMSKSRRDYYLVNPQFDNKGASVDDPCFTLIARMDKKAPSLVEAEKSDIEGFGWIIYEGDSETMKKIKLFMALHGIVDIKMRMLRVKELLQIQGFGKNYKLVGTQTDHKRFIGNSVPPGLVKAKVKARIQKLHEWMQRKAA